MNPQENDIVIGTIIQKNPEFYLVDLNAESYGVLQGMEFQNATKRDRPNLPEGTLVYCRVLKAEKFTKIQLTCISLLHKKAWNSGEAFFGELKGGLVKDFPIGFCRKLLLDGHLLERLGEKFQYEVNIGYNGRIHIKSERPIDTIFIFNALEKVVEMGDTAENVEFIMQKLLMGGQ